MCDAEFVIPSRLENLFQAAVKQYCVKDVMTKQSVTVEVLQLKRSMYNDTAGFIFNNFDIYCNLIRQFSEFDESLKITAFRILIQVSDKVNTLLSTALDEEIEEFNQDESFSHRNLLKMTVYLLCEFAHAFEGEQLKKTASDKITKGRKKKQTVDDSDLSEWPEERLKFIVAVKKFFLIPIRKFWNPPIIEYDFTSFVTNAFFQLLENTEVSKDKGMKLEIFRFLGGVLSENRTGLGYSIKILQLVQDFEHLPIVMAEAVMHFVKENAADTLISDICRESTLLDVKTLTQNLTAAHSLSQFLVSICESCTEKVMAVIGSLLQFLEMESHVMRNCVLSIIGIILTKVLANENISKKEQQTREDLLSHIEAHLWDANSFVRCRAIQVLKNLMDDKALASVELHHFGMLVSNRIQDKVKYVPLTVLRESYQTESEKLNLMKKSRPLIFEDSDDEEEAAEKSVGNAVIFDDSDEEDAMDVEKDPEEKSPEEQATDSAKESADKEAEATDKPSEPVDETSEEECQKQQTLVNYLRDTLNFAEVIHGLSEPVCALLHSSTNTDVLEAIEFFTAAATSLVNGSDSGIREILNLVWSNETAVKDAALNAFKSLYLSDIKNIKKDPEVANNLLALLKGGTNDDALNLQAFVQHFCKLGEIPEIISSVLWSKFTNPDSGASVEDKVAILLFIGMASEDCPTFVLGHIDELVKHGLGLEGESNYQLAMYTFQALEKSNRKQRGKYSSLSQSDLELRLPQNHIIVKHFKHLLVNGIRNFEDDQWCPMADSALSALFSIMEDPVLLCEEIALKVMNTVYGNNNVADLGEDTACEIPNILLSRFMAFCGHVAIHYLTYLKVDHFASLRRQELEREQRRRKSKANSINFSTPKYNSIHHSPRSKSGKKSSKKRQSIGHKSYKLLPPMDEEATYEIILKMCEKEVRDDKKLIGRLFPLVTMTCRSCLKNFNKEVLAAASNALAKFMLFSESVCQEMMQIFATITEMSSEAYIRANMVIAMADLITLYPNIVEPWTPKIYQRLNDESVSVREAAIVTITHLILHDFIRVKSLISDAAKCIADAEKTVSDVAKYLFAELSKKGNVIYNIIPDIISTLSDPKCSFSEEKFQIVLRHMLQYIEKEKLIEGLVEKLCCRFTDSSTDVQLHELTFCLSILTLNDKCYSKLMEFKNLLKERMSDPVILKYITNITANAKKNDAKTAAELETFRKELGI
ncbi:hypothetical protein JTE90_005619 [Oedothorax gibbosus]|uniref:Condensin complex subunit 1 n=1 Tax=Oedothorax gibbosus TaxID=931172 RepID=A0AAV6UK14_9ARAC|nr:hypothetical protein JTE90_005619 [Oedothorax gibbosus]